MLLFGDGMFIGEPGGLTKPPLPIERRACPCAIEAILFPLQNDIPKAALKKQCSILKLRDNCNVEQKGCPLSPLRLNCIPYFFGRG